VARGFLDIAEESGDDDAFERVHRALNRMDRLIENVLSLARKGQVVGETSERDVIELAREAWAGVDTEAATLDASGECVVDCDENRLRDLFGNLFRNSVEHGSTGSRTQSDDSVEHGSTSNRPQTGDSVEHAGPDVTVRVGTLDDGDGFYVEDDGPGIAPSERERVFEPGHSTGENGAGFGLPIVRRIAEAHGWTLDLTEADGGARFEIRVRGDDAAD
jgi:signal transduction histidine kinase